jgi:hypothetical protein
MELSTTVPFQATSAPTPPGRSSIGLQAVCDLRMFLVYDSHSRGVGLNDPIDRSLPQKPSRQAERGNARRPIPLMRSRKRWAQVDAPIRFYHAPTSPCHLSPCLTLSKETNWQWSTRLVAPQESRKELQGEGEGEG